jgi:hypothetical protein
MERWGLCSLCERWYYLSRTGLAADDACPVCLQRPATVELRETA